MRRILLVILPLVFTGCGDKSPAADTTAPPVKLVKAITVGQGEEADERRFSGEVRARTETLVGFRVGGKMTERMVDAGARIKAGQPLARLDPSDARLAASQAEANAALAAADLKRTRELRDRNFVSQAALDARETTARAAEAQAQLTRNQAAYTTLVADAAGVVAAVLAEPGQVLAAGQGVLRIARDGEREVAIALPEAELARVRVGSPAVVTLWADGRNWPAKVREIAPAADPATRTFAARVTLVGADAGLALGLSASVSFPREGTMAVVVPPAALYQQDGKPAVWIIDAGNTVQLRAIDVATYRDDGVVVRSGLAAGERIVAAGAFRLAAGEKVRIAGQ
ncbi:MAG: efflux RND transporter periplasmic adaptor subunit [Dechloromonas sp.]|nr:MAG: efflux RND transporter periplasmic adaptor subunit [Dechloromonas sp.]